MECAFLTVIFVSFFAVYSSFSGVPDWEDVVVTREGIPTVLICTDTTVRGAVAINWKVQPVGPEKEWKLVLSANEKKEFSGGATKKSTRLTDPNFQDTGVFSLFLLPRFEDRGLYSCMLKQKERKLKEKIILLAILEVTVVPPPPVPHRSPLRLTASVSPDYAVTQITWTAPSGNIMKSEKKPKSTVLAKLPQVENDDTGAYVCTVYPWGNSSNSLLAFSVNVTLDDDKVSSLHITHETEISTATKANTPVPLTCPDVKGDYVRLYWLRADAKKHNEIQLVYTYDRWRGSTVNNKSPMLELAGPPYNAEAGSFSFILTPGYKDGGLYICEVFCDEDAFSKRTRLSVLKVTTSLSSSKLELGCLYSERSQVISAVWKHQKNSRRLKMSSKQPGSISTYLPLPITSDTAGNYTCTIQLEKGQTVSATQAVNLPNEDTKDVSVSVPTPSLPPSLSALLLLVPLVAAAVGVLLWRQKHISDRGIEQSLSVISRETENIYENPEDIRQAPPQGSVYMDLKPRGEDDVYKELE
ncbi:LOW QUALITY PROTEIN: g6f-like [Trematomus bernacchii]|uniref:LOW QUALITY PROTEIN: g6f-like n=1 Tax=Trematomus bernacchii TaxID=40690 RepID=UPI00146A2CDE|nr:LOW QUALITY PROTEIN: g6f-like [Trematomus bernacchii]